MVWLLFCMHRSLSLLTVFYLSFSLFGGVCVVCRQHWRWQRKLVCRIFNVGALREYTSHVFTRQSQLVVDYFNKITEQSDQPSSGAEEAIVDLQSIFLLFTLGKDE